MKLIKIIIFLLISFNLPLKVNSSDDIQKAFNGNGKLIFIRHAYAPGGGDPDNFDISNCTTQRNLNTKGIEQSINIGKFFLKNDIVIGKVLSSEWCRCKKTAEFAFKNYETRNFLNSFFSKKFSHNKNSQIKELKKYIKNWDGKKNLIFITHYVVILEVLGLSVSSGEIIVTDKDFNILARQKNYNN
jgi:phosphohistidine phosphatase SixA|tara:strand:+ start:1563 stop:2123 length:561 start_codon:yes stop_codon:yes gene_type:complete